MCKKICLLAFWHIEFLAEHFATLDVYSLETEWDVSKLDFEYIFLVPEHRDTTITLSLISLFWLVAEERGSHQVRLVVLTTIKVLILLLERMVPSREPATSSMISTIPGNI